MPSHAAEFPHAAESHRASDLQAGSSFVVDDQRDNLRRVSINSGDADNQSSFTNGIQWETHKEFDRTDIPNLFDPATLLDPNKLMQAVCHSFLTSRTGLGHFTRLSLQPRHACTVHGSSTKLPLWPVPPPRWSWPACKHLGIRRRRRRRFFEARSRMLQILVASLNWETLGHPTVPPDRAKIGSLINKAQRQILERLESKIDHFLRAADFSPDDLGRACDKFQGVINRAKELPQCQLGLQDREQLFTQIHSNITRSSSDTGQVLGSSNLGGSPADPCYESREEPPENQKSPSTSSVCF